jgi:mucin-19
MFIRLDIVFKKALSFCAVMAVLLASALSALNAAAQTCSIPGNAGPVTLTTYPNTYYPGGTVALGATALTIGAGTTTGVASAIAPGDLLLIIQMQGADINSSNTNLYGDNTGDGTIVSNTATAANLARGSTANTAGTYEFAVATNTVGAGGGTVNLSAPLQFGYTTAAATAIKGQQRFQVVRMQQYSSLTLGANIDVFPWNGNTGGVLALDVAGDLDLGGRTINGNSRGFRGAGGFLSTGAVCTTNAGDSPCTDYVSLNAATNVHLGVFKGEGIAGTPAFLFNSLTATTIGSITGADGYPGGDRSRGAPGNAGGGGNQHNGGGGGGGNGGLGGFGGNTWNGQSRTNFSGLPYGGIGGASGYNSATRIIMGGGGGAGDANNTGTPHGGSGGAIVMIRAGRVLGTGTINTNGAAGTASTGTDASGAGGAGGSVWVTTGAGTLPATLSINALGGAGANSGNMGGSVETDGPGGGGGGGQFITNATGATVSLLGGVNGVILNSTNAVCTGANISCGATPGGAGTTLNIGAFPFALTGVRPGPECLPDIRVTKATTTPNITASGAVTASYTINIQNFGGAARNLAVLDSALPPGWTLAAAPTYTYLLPLPLAANQLSTGAEASTTAGGATFPLVAVPGVVPTNGSSTLTWRQFFVGPLKANTPSSMTISFVINVPATAPVGCYHNPAGFTLLDPTRLAADATREMTSATNNGANRSATNYSANTTYASGGTTTLAGSNYSGLAAGPATEDVCLQGDLAVTKAVSTTTVAAGQTVVYTLTPTNNGRQVRALTFAADQTTDATATQLLSAGGLRVVDTLPAGVTLTSGFTGTGWACTSVGQTVTCDAALPAPANANLNAITATALVSQAACGTSLVNNATITGLQTPYVDTNTANNASAVTTTVACSANLQISKTDGVTTTQAGSTTAYTITLSNNGPSSADGAIAKDTPSAGLSNCTVTGCTASGGLPAASCPAVATRPNLLTPGGVAIPSFSSGGQVVFTVRCNVSATGQ